MNRAVYVGMIIISVLLMAVHLFFTFSGAQNATFLGFSTLQMFLVGLLFLAVAFLLWAVTSNAQNPARLVAWAILLIGLAGLAVYAVYRFGGSGTIFQTFEVDHIGILGLIYAVIGFILLFVARGIEAATPAPAVAVATPSSASRPTTYTSQPSTPARPMVEERTVVGTPAKVEEQRTAIANQIAAVRPDPDRTVAVPPVAPASKGPSVASTRDDLKIIEGIGPKVEEALYKAGITTYIQLANMTNNELTHIVKDEHGVRIVGDADTWPKQARFLVNGDMEGFKAYQAKIVGGREKLD
jgi:predicted flap endonuclease-1-like 5' DNA nuclease